MTQQTDTTGIPVEAVVYRIIVALKNHKMICTSISREDMPYKPNPWEEMRPLTYDEQRDGPRLIFAMGSFMGALIIALAIYGLAHWHVWSKMSEIITAWRVF